MKNEVNIPVLKKLVEDLYPVTVDMTTKRKHTLVLGIYTLFVHYVKAWYEKKPNVTNGHNCNLVSLFLYAYLTDLVIAATIIPNNYDSGQKWIKAYFFLLPAFVPASDMPPVCESETILPQQLAIFPYYVLVAAEKQR